MVENQTEVRDLFSGRGAAWKGKQDSGVQDDVQEALDTDLDAYLDRELLVQPIPEVAPEVTPVPAVEKAAESLQEVLALAAEEQQWLRDLPAPELPAENSLDLDGGECPIPEHLKAQPAAEVSPPAPVEPPPVESPFIPQPAPLPGLAVPAHVVSPGWVVPVAPVAAPEEPRRMPWIAAGALVGVSAASLFVAGVLWMNWPRMPDTAQVVASYVPADSVAAVTPPPPAPAHEPALSAKDAPLPRQSEPLLGSGGAAAQNPQPSTPVEEPKPQASAAEAMAQATLLPAPQANPGVSALPATEAPAGGKSSEAPQSPAPALASVTTGALKSGKGTRTRATPAVEARREIEDPYLEDTEDETPLLAEPAPAPAPAVVAEATPPAPPSKSGYEELDEEFARELGFTEGATPKVPESKGVKSVWVPPAPTEAIAEKLTPEDIQKVVVANQPAIASCVRRHKEALPGMSGGRFVMRWFVYPSGSTYQVAVETDALKGTALATCIEGLVRDWKFPKHRVQQGPIRFPFVF